MSSLYDPMLHESQQVPQLLSKQIEYCYAGLQGTQIHQPQQIFERATG